MFSTDRLVLVPFVDYDIHDETYQSWFKDPDVTRFTSHGYFSYTEKKQDEFVASLDHAAVLRILVDWEWIGNIALQCIDWIHRSAEFAIIIGEKDYWNKGYAKEAGGVVLRHGFESLNLNRIWCGTAEYNIGMRRLAESLGMKEEGQLRSAVFYHGQYMNIIKYGILREEWTK